MTRPLRPLRTAVFVGVNLILLLSTARCGQSAGPAAEPGEVTIRIGVSSGQAAAANPVSGIVPIVQNLSIESLARIGDDGRPKPQLAEGWDLGADGMSAIIRLRPGLRFSDGSPVIAADVADLLNTTLAKMMGPAFEDVERIYAPSDAKIAISFRRPSPFLLESLEVPITKTGAGIIGTGPFVLSSSAPNELHANDSYYRGRPTIDRVIVTSYPTVRAAWADMLRDRLDMLYEVGVDALDSMTASSNVKLYTFTRRYQYDIIFNRRAPALRSAKVRRALNIAIDRQAVIRDALSQHAVPSFGPIWPQHWSVTPDLPIFKFDPSAAAKDLKGLKFTCLVPPDYERLALIVKRQLESAGVEIELRQDAPAQILGDVKEGNFEAVLFDLISGQSLFRPYTFWHSAGSRNLGQGGDPVLDEALDGLRHAASDTEYRKAVAVIQQTVVEDPPAIFLAWSMRARAVSTRFDVPATEPGRDVLATLPFWTLNPSAGKTARVH